MRVQSFSIERWRNIEGVELEVPSDLALICLVGENGTAKSNLLELIVTAAHFLGLTPSLALNRPHPRDRQDPFKVSVTFDVHDKLALEDLEAPGQEDLEAPGQEEYARRGEELRVSDWDGTVVFEGEGVHHPVDDRAVPVGYNDPVKANVGDYQMGVPEYTSWWVPLAGGLADRIQAFHLGNRIVAALKRRPEVMHLYLDADRVFPTSEIRDDEVLALAHEDTAAWGWARTQAAALAQNLYLQWLLQMIGTQQRRQEAYWETSLDAAARGEAIEAPIDPFDGFRGALGRLLPHLRFLRPDQEKRRLIFDAAGVELSYEELSGGEREVAFVVGQIERFAMRDGIFLIDEPELHLNAELLRGVLEYLSSTVDAGQVWIATHALEAAEVAGGRATLVCERGDGVNPAVGEIALLGDRPVLETLASALGSPGFSLIRSKFVLIEGKRPGRERERFVQLLDATPAHHFIESGGCDEVLTGLRHLLDVASETEQLRIGAVIDRDMRSDAQAAEIVDQGAFVLPVTEVENLFLHPPLVEAIASQDDVTADEARSLVRDLGDRFAGKWIFERTSMQEGWHEGLNEASGRARSLTFGELDRDDKEETKRIADGIADLSKLEVAKRAQRLRGSLDEWRRIREDPEQLWRQCFGKEVLTRLPPMIGLSGVEAYEKRAAQLWKSGAVVGPVEVDALREYIENLPLTGA